MPPFSEKVLSHKSRILALAYLLAVTTLIFGLFDNWSYDDPYITYRYAANLIHGQGFVYNPAERVLSITSPLFAAILAAGGMVWSDLPRLANLLGAFFLALGALILLDLGKSWKTPQVGWSALWLYPSFPLLLSTLGSEMPLYLALCLGSFAFYARRRYSWCAAAAALAVLTRPDALLVPLLLAADFAIHKVRPIPWRAVFVFLALTLPFLLARLALLRLAVAHHPGCQTAPGLDADQPELRTGIADHHPGIQPAMGLLARSRVRPPGRLVDVPARSLLAALRLLGGDLLPRLYPPGGQPLLLVLRAAGAGFYSPGRSGDGAAGPLCSSSAGPADGTPPGTPCWQ